MSLRKPILVLIFVCVINVVPSPYGRAQDIEPPLSVSYTETAEITIDDTLLSVAWHPIGELFAVSGLKGVYVYDADYQFLTHLTFGDDPEVVSTVWSSDGERAASLLWSGEVYVWNVADYSVDTLLDSKVDIPTSIAWSPDNTKIVIGSGDGLLRLFAFNPLRRIVSDNDDNFGAITSISWNSDSCQLIVGGPSSTVWDTCTFEQQYVFGGGSLLPSWSPDGKWIALGGIIPSQLSLPALSLIYISDVESGGLRQVILLDEYEHDPLLFYALKWQPGGVLIASYNVDQKIRIWDAFSGELMVELPGGTSLSVTDAASYDSIAWSPDGTQLANASKDGVVYIWTIETTNS